MKTALLLALLLASRPPLHSAAAGEIEETMSSSFEAFLDGRSEEAYKGYRYLSIVAASSAAPQANMAVLNRDMGQIKESLPLWIQVSLYGQADGFVWNQRAWTYAALDQMAEARDAFLKAIDRASQTAEQAEANFGAGLAYLSDSQPKAALAALRSALVQGPYIIPAASYLTALASLAIDDRPAAMLYLRESLDLEPLNLEALRELAQLYEEIGETRAAWRLYHRLLGFEPENGEFEKKIAKLARYITGDPERSLPIRRIARPVLTEGLKGAIEPSRSTTTIRVGLFSGADSSPRTAQRIYFVSNSQFRLVAGSGDAVRDEAPAMTQWEVAFRGESGVVEVRDSEGNIVFASKQPFRVIPLPRDGSILIKSALFERTFGFDIGDRELRGAIKFIPNPKGFKLVNELPLEDYLYGAVAAALPTGSPFEAYRAQSIISRTIALWHKENAKPSLEGVEICDSPSCQRYLGVSEEMRDASRAVAATEGLRLTLGGKIAPVRQHENCGGMTEDGATSGLSHLVSVDDSRLPQARPRAPIEIERFLHNFPGKDNFCEAAGFLPSAQSRWVRILKTKDLERRANSIQAIDRIIHIRAAKRSRTGRIQTLEVIGTGGRLLLEGEKAISDFLSPASLRSTLFAIQPLLRGHRAERFILWGAGTGSGLGFCKAGAIGQASMGKDSASILAHYFPKLAVQNAARAAVALDKTLEPRTRKPRNPRWSR
ncbi:MAG: SpoIID/LytB domain-containing protein [Elusimicrobia bacterium]|nr:SpoIID/LytB domain-containing protein [Elusimicrobiota bacterium]